MQPGSSKDLRSSHTSKPGERLYKAFKLLEDKEKGAPANIKRYDGRVPGNPSYDVANVSDPRPKYDIFHRIKTTLDLPVPHFVIDDNYTGIPPKREVSVFDLNDNVNTTFLKTMASKVGDVVDIDVYYHPDRNKHLQMAMIFFREEADAFSFIRQQNGKSVMGIPIRCVSDPFFALLSQVYEQKVGQSCPVQNHLKSLSPHMLESKREKLRRNAKNEPSVSGYNSSFLDVDMDLQNSPEFEPAKPKQPRTPSPDEMTTIRPQFSFERSGTEPKSVERDSRTESSERPLEENTGYRNHPTVPPPSYNSLPPTTIYNHFGQPPPSYYESDKYVKKRTPSPRSPERRRSRENKSKKKKKRSRQSSESRSSSTESSSLSDTEYLTVEKKEKSLKYTRAKEGGEIVEKKIKTVTYKRKEAKRGDSRASASGLQKISSDEDSGREQHKDKKKQDHRWSSSSSDSEEERKKRRHKATERVKKREAAHHLPGFGVGPSKNPPTPKTPSMPDIHHPPPPIVPASVGITSPMIPLFNPNQPPPMIPFHVPPPMIPPFTAPHGMFPPVAPASNVPSVGLRFVDSPPQEKPSLEDRLASLFGHKTEGPSTPAEATSIKEESYEDQVEDMDVEIDSDQSRSDDDAPPQIKEEPIDMALHMQNIVSNLCADIENELRKELCSVLAKDLQNKLQSHAFQHMEVVWQSKRAAMEEEKKNQAIAALKASQEVIKASPEKQNENKATNSAMLMTASFSIPKKITYQKKEIVDVKPKPFSGSISDHSAFSSDASDAEGSDGTKSSSESDGSTSGPIVKKLKNHSSAASSFSSSLESDSDSDKENVSSSEIPESAVASSDEAPSTLESSQVLLKDRKPEVVPEPQKVELIWPAATTNLKLLPPLSETITRDEYHVTLTEHCYYNINKVAPSRLTGYQLAQLQQRKLPQKPISKVVKKNELSTLLPSVSYREVKPPPVAKITFPDRTLEEKKKIIFTWEAALDSEDQKFVQEALAQLQPADGPLPPWKHIVPFAPVGFTPSPKLLKNRVTLGRIERYYDDEELDGILPHEFGCARARGYFKMSMKQKRSLIRRPEDVYQDKTDISERDEAAARHQVQQNKESRMLHRRLLTTMGDTNTDFFKVNQLKYRKKVIKFARSRIHGWGLYALEPIAPDDMIVEYVGQKIRSLVADEREKQYERRGIGSSYLFRIDENSVIDATKMGNFARFINHSCQPNCYAKVVTVDGDKRIVIYSKTLINKGDEITYDYKFPIEDDKIDCLCNAPNCRGTLN